MAKITMVTSGLNGILNTTLELSNRLREEGHQVTYVSIRNVQEKVEEAGFPFVKISDINRYYSFSSHISKNYPFPLPNIIHFLNKKINYETGVAELNFHDYEKILKEINPDFVLIDEELHEIIFLCYKLKIPFKLLSVFFTLRFGLDLPPIRTNIIPLKTASVRNSFRIVFACLKNKAKIHLKSVSNSLLLKGNRKNVLYYYAKNIGFPVNTLISRIFPSYFIHSGVPILCLNFRELDFKNIHSKNVKYIGPMVSMGSNYSKQTKQLDNKLNSLLEKANHQKIIYCSLTTMDGARDILFIKKVIAAVATQSQYLLIVSLGGKISPADFEGLPENVHLFPWVPQSELLQKVDCCINHGGVNTINECVHSKVPMLVYSGKRFDQNGNAARVQYHGIGLMGDKDTESSNMILSKLKRVLDENIFLNNLNQLDSKSKNYRNQRLTPCLFE